MNQQSKHSANTKRSAATFLIVSLSCLSVGGLLLYGPIEQPSTYHAFADKRVVFNVPNFWNVVSNLPFVLLGIIGLQKSLASVILENKTSLMVLCIGVMLTGFSSALYHLQPDNWGLFWDRLSMALTFMAFLALIIEKCISSTLGRKLLAPLVLFGLFSVVYWIMTEQYGTGDLRPYAVTQFLSMLLITVIVIFWKSESITIADMLIIGFWYWLAKLFEYYDHQLYQLISLSGHTLKHLAAACSVFWILSALNRQRQNAPQHQLEHHGVHQS